MTPASISPLVTIAIPTYNRAGSYLPQALQCALHQTYPNFELIVSDNGSTDHTRDLVTSIGDTRIRYFRHDPNIGANNNFNFCFAQARGKYSLLLHDDDLIDLDFVESCIRAGAVSSEAGIIRTGTRLIDADGKILHEVPNGAVGLSTEAFFRAWFSAKTPIYLCSTLFHTERLRKIGGFHSKHNCYQDTMAVVQLAAQHGRVDVPDVKASFRRHPGEMVLRRTIDEWCEDSLALLDLMCELVPENKNGIHREGLRFFSRANYGRAGMAKAPFARFAASIKVLKYFRFRQLPSFKHLLSIFSGTHLYETLRQIKRSAQYVFSQAPGG
jgi:glycosyltransferase involved in cell wall biosynthesis